MLAFKWFRAFLVLPTVTSILTFFNHLNNGGVGAPTSLMMAIVMIMIAVGLLVGKPAMYRIVSAGVCGFLATSIGYALVARTMASLPEPTNTTYPALEFERTAAFYAGIVCVLLFAVTTAIVGMIERRTRHAKQGIPSIPVESGLGTRINGARGR